MRNPEEGLWDLNGEANVAIFKERQIGDLDGPEEFLFVYITDLAVNSKGDFYVADRQLNENRKFNKDGEYLLTMGRFGQGPGEFQSIKIGFENVFILFRVYGSSCPKFYPTKRLQFSYEAGNISSQDKGRRCVLALNRQAQCASRASWTARPPV